MITLTKDQASELLAARAGDAALHALGRPRVCEKMTDSTTYTWPTGGGADSSGNYVTTIGTGTTFTPYVTSSTWSSEYAEKKQLEAWLRILVARIEKLQDKVKELEGKVDGR